MQSTLLGYQLVARDFAASIARAEAEPITKRETAYYEANIGKVKSLDDFLNNYRLYSYAMKAYGLEDQINSKAFMRKVLESDLTSSKSFANTLVDSRYRSFAAAFDFPKAEATEPKAATTAQLNAVVEAYSEHDVRVSAAAAQKAAAFTLRVGAITSVDAFLADGIVYEVGLRAAGLDPAMMSREAIRQVLTGGPVGSTAQAALKSLFQFDSNGAVASGGLHGASSASDVVSRYYGAMGLSATPVAAAHEVGYFESKVGTIATVDDLVFDARLFRTVLTAVGLDPAVETPLYIASILKSDPANPSSPLATMSASDSRKAALTTLNSAFNFATDGTVPMGQPVQDAAGLAAIREGYFTRYDDKAVRADQNATRLFKAALGNPVRADALIRNDKVFEYLMTAFDLDPATESRTKVLRVLKSDPSDPKSYANKLKDERYQRLAAAFNFDEDGNVAARRLAQSEAKQTATAQAYTKTLGADPAQVTKDNAKKATAAYAEALAGVIDIDDFVSNKAITDYALKAYGLDGETLSVKDLKALLTSDLADPNSVARRKGDQRYVDFVGAFNFETDGSIRRSEGSVQSAADRLAVRQAYVRQQIEETAGDTSEGVRLALYFQRKAPTLTTAFQLLADKALVEFTRTALNLPDAFSQLDIEKQAKILESKIDFAKLKEEKTVDRWISRFAGFYDIANGSAQGGAAAGALALLNGGGGSAGGNLLAYL